MPYDVCDTRQVFFPAAALGLNVSVAINWANGSWVELTPDCGGDALLLTQLLQRQAATQWAGHEETEVGVGAAGAEAVIFTARSYCSQYVNAAPTGIHRTPVPIDLIPAHSRIAIRCRKGSNGTWAFYCGIGALIKPAVTTMELATTPQLCTPSKADSITLPVSTTPGADSAYVQIVASTATAIHVLGLALYIPNLLAYGYFEIDLATGAGGAEQVFTTITGATGNAGGGRPYYEALMLTYPVAVTQGLRIAARVRQPSVTAGSFAVALLYRVAP